MVRSVITRDLTLPVFICWRSKAKEPSTQDGAPKWAMSQTTHTHTWNSFTDVKDHIHVGTGTHTGMVAHIHAHVN